jgi:hypothetical protein
VAFLMHRWGPTYYADMRNEQLVPASNVLVHFEPKVRCRKQTVTRA